MSIIHITKENYASIVNQSEKPVLIDFWATWCGPCKMIAPFIEEIAAERDDLIVSKIDVDQEMELAMQFKIASIPTLVLMKNGTVTGTLIGYRPKADILKFIEA
jgi:thioredoxin 1